jgi:hypothetical protein
MENITMEMKKQSAPQASTKEPASIVLDETATVNVKCLATAFRALSVDDASRKRKDGKGKDAKGKDAKGRAKPAPKTGGTK